MANSLLSELKRRKVLRFIAIYAVVAYGVIQVAEIVLPNLGVPEWSVTLVIVLAGLGFPLALVLSWMFDMTTHGVERTGAAATEPETASGQASAAGIPTATPVTPKAPTEPGSKTDALPDSGRSSAPGSIAVLSFADMSPEQDQEFFCDGIAEEIIDALVGVDGLEVVARTSAFAYKGSDKDLRTIGAELSVVAVLEGSVRKSGDQVRITAQLIKVDDGYHLWSEKYDRKMSDIFQIQEDIAKSVCDRLCAALGVTVEAPVLRTHTDNPLAYELYLQGRYHWERRHQVGLEMSRDRFQEALELDPRYVLALAGLAETWIFLAYYLHCTIEAAQQKVGPLIERALKLDDTCPEVYRAMALRACWLEWDFAGAEEAFSKSLELNPSAALTHGLYTYLLATLNRVDELRVHVQKAIELEPESTAVRSSAAAGLAISRQYDACIEVARSVIAVDPAHVLAHYVLGLSLIGLGEPEAGIRHLRTSSDLSRRASGVYGFLGWGLAFTGESEEAAEIEREMRRRGESGATQWSLLAVINYELGHLEQARRDIDRAVEEREPLLSLHGQLLVFDGARTDPEMRGSLRRVGLPETEL